MLVGHVIHVDHFGNLITDIREADLKDRNVELEIRAHSIKGLSRYYAQGSHLLALIGSSGNLEIASKESNASLILGAVLGEEVIVRWGKVGKGRRS
jgi:S-adenosylmethionine hydrolase